MNKRTRLVFLSISFIALIIIGRFVTNSFSFIISQFWFTSGLFLLILLSLIDQPNFSKDSNVFINATVAWMSLILISPETRDWVWWTFFSIATYLILTSYILIWVRKYELKYEHLFIALITRINREIGRPEALFSAFFIWGAVRQFGINSGQFDALLIFWIVFMILNMPAFARAFDKILNLKIKECENVHGEIIKLIEPKVAEVLLPTTFQEDLIGKEVEVFSADNEKLGIGVFIDERIICGSRIGKIVITSTEKIWRKISDTSKGYNIIQLSSNIPSKELPISVVDKGTSIDNLVFYLNPKINLLEGEIVFVHNFDDAKVFYQIVSAIITEEISNEGNSLQCIKVTASQLGLWDDSFKTFSPYSWVPPSGQLIYQGENINIDITKIPETSLIVGTVPKSTFPVHANIEDLVTHNTAIIGVTGSGKSYLAFHIIESLIHKGIKVMVLDLTREHYQYLHKHNPYQLSKSGDVKTWLTTPDSPFLAIHQFATATSFPASTHEFIKAAFEVLSSAKLTAGKNLPARLCVVFEEAHSLVPEWNQVSVQGDKDQVNSTARIILQGRKFGIGSLLITQRTANVTKTILNQCNTIFAMQSFDQTGLEFLKNYMGDEYSGALSRLPQRQSVLVGKASSSQRPIIIQIDNYSKRWKDPAEETEVKIHE